MCCPAQAVFLSFLCIAQFIGFGSTATLSKMKWLLKINKVNECYIRTIDLSCVENIL